MTMVRTILGCFRALIIRLLQFCELCCWAILLVWVGLLTVGSIARYIFASPIISQGDITAALLLVFCSLAFGPVMMRNAHVRVDTVIRLLPVRARFWLDVANDVVTIIFCGLMIALMQRILRMTWALGSRFDVSGLPILPVQILMPVGFALIALAALLALVERFLFILTAHADADQPRSA